MLQRIQKSCAQSHHRPCAPRPLNLYRSFRFPVRYQLPSLTTSFLFVVTEPYSVANCDKGRGQSLRVGGGNFRFERTESYTTSILDGVRTHVSSNASAMYRVAVRPSGVVTTASSPQYAVAAAS